MKRNKQNLLLYKKTCRQVYERADGRCEVEINGKRCGRFILFEQARYINFAHTETRNGKSDDWVCEPDNIIFTCAEHHIEEEMTGKRMKKSNEITYVPCD